MADATYPVTGYQGTVNPDAITQLRQETLQRQNAKDAASGVPR